MSTIKAVIKDRVWFWRPQWHWYGWRTLSPIFRGHDEFGRRTVVLGWTITGRAIIALWTCGDPECIDFAQELRNSHD